MALVIATFKTDADVVSDLLEAEQDTAAHQEAAVAAIKADADSITELYRLWFVCGTFLAQMGLCPIPQPTDLHPSIDV